MVIISDCIAKGSAIIKPNIPDSRFEAEILLSHVLKKDRLYLTVHKNDVVSDEDAQLFFKLCSRRSYGEPSAYITGVKEFMSMEFEVNSNVLIPRPETEHLVELIADKYQTKEVHILDLCTGSRAIACSLAKLIENSSVTAADISSDALDVAKRNAKKIGVDNKIRFIRCDVLKEYDFGQKYDVVVSNPPYIESETISTLDVGVKDFEPLLALDGGDDGLTFYRAITRGIRNMLNIGGELYYEIGLNQGNAVKNIMESYLTNVTVIKDYSGHDRIVCGQLL